MFCCRMAEVTCTKCVRHRDKVIFAKREYSVDQIMAFALIAQILLQTVCEEGEEVFLQIVANHPGGSKP